MVQKIDYTDFEERFKKFESANGLVRAILGAAVIYVAIFHVQYVLHALGASIGLKEFLQGVHDIFYNPAKKQAVINSAAKKYMNSGNSA